MLEARLALGVVREANGWAGLLRAVPLAVASDIALISLRIKKEPRGCAALQVSKQITA